MLSRAIHAIILSLWNRRDFVLLLIVVAVIIAELDIAVTKPDAVETDALPQPVTTVTGNVTGQASSGRTGSWQGSGQPGSGQSGSFQNAPVAAPPRITRRVEPPPGKLFPQAEYGQNVPSSQQIGPRPQTGPSSAARGSTSGMGPATAPPAEETSLRLPPEMGFERENAPGKADVRAYLIYPARPAMVLINVSKQETARKATAKARFWNLSRPRGDVLVRAAARIDSCPPLPPGESCGPVSLQFQNPPAEGDELFGFVTVQCQACATSHVYWADIIVGKRGAFIEGKMIDYDWDHMNPLNARQVADNFKARKDLWQIRDKLP